MADEPRDADDAPLEVGRPRRVDGPTPAGGVYSLVMLRPDGSVEIAECDAGGNYLRSTISPPPR